MPYTDTQKEERLEHIRLLDTQTNARHATEHNKSQFVWVKTATGLELWLPDNSSKNKN